MQQLPLGVRWRDSSTFANFVSGANAAIVRQLEQLERTTPLALWLWSAAGSGKTHLAQACCAHAGEQGRSAAYLPLGRDNGEVEDTKNGPSTRLQNVDADALRPEALLGCEQLDLVCIDDADVVAGDGRWELALFNLYNGVQEHGGRLLLTGRQPPVAAQWALADLKSRIAAAVVLHMQPLLEEHQIEVLRLRARNRGLELPDETATFLLRHHPRDLRALCALLDTLDTASLAAQRRLTIPFIKSAIRTTERSRPP